MFHVEHSSNLSRQCAYEPSRFIPLSKTNFPALRTHTYLIFVYENPVLKGAPGRCSRPRAEESGRGIVRCALETRAGAARHFP